MTSLKKPNMGFLLNTHEIDKAVDALVYVAKEEKCSPEILKLTERLSEAMADALSILQHPEDIANGKRVREKYKHNIPAVLRQTVEDGENEDRED
jgi:hypothetical protein